MSISQHADTGAEHDHPDAVEPEVKEAQQEASRSGYARLNRSWRALLTTGFLGGIEVGLGILVLNLATIMLLRADEFYVHEQGWEYNAVQAAIGLLLLAHGSGRAGLDHLFVRPKDDGHELIVDEEDAHRIQPQEY